MNVTSRTPQSVTPVSVPAQSLDDILSLLPPAAGERVRALVERGRQQEARLQVLQQLSASLARTLDEDDIAQELARGVPRVVPCEGVVVAEVDLDRGLIAVVRHVVGDVELPPRVVPHAHGALAEAARSGVPVLVTPYEPAHPALADEDDVLSGRATAGAVLAVPMMHGRRLLGVVAVHDSDADAFGGEARELLWTLATHAAGALSNARLFADSERERRQSDAMAEIARAVGESLRMGEVLRLILRHAMALLQAEGACIALRSGDYLEVVSSLGIAKLLAGVHFPLGGSMSGRVVTSGAAMVTNDMRMEPDVHRASLRLLAAEKAIIVPLVTARGIIGVLAVYNRPVEFTGDDARILQRLADQVAVAIVNARLFEEVQDATREWLAAFESIAVGMCIVDEDGRITRFNTRALQLAGQDAPRTLVGRPFYQAMLGAPYQLEDDPVARAIQDVARSRAVCIGHRGRAFDISAAPHPSGGAIITFDDVSALVHSLQERAREGPTGEQTPLSPPTVEQAFDLASDLVFTLDVQGSITTANQATGAALDAPPADLTGRSIHAFVAGGDVGRLSDVLRDVHEGGERVIECTVVRSAGGRRVVRLTLTPMRLGDMVVGVLAVGRDLTDERARADALARTEARYAELIESASDAVFMLDAEGTFTTVNASLELATGRRQDDLVGRPFTEVVAPDDRQAMWDLFVTVVRGGRRRSRMRWVDAAGATHPASLVVTPIVHDDRVIGVLGIARPRLRDSHRASR